MDQFIHAYVDKGRTPGVVTLIARHGKVVHFSSAGMQDVEAKTPLTEKTIFRIASMSKPITSVAVMILVDEGKINVADPLSKYVPEFKDMKVLVPDKDGKNYELVNAKREITIHDLLTHSSGITYGLMNKPFISEKYADGGVNDGLSETKEAIGGLYVVDCASRDDALELAARIPQSPGAVVEVLTVAEL